MCTYTMEPVVDPYESLDGLEVDSDWLSKYMETENVFLDYLKCLTFTSPSNVDAADAILPEYDGSESGFEALDNLCDLLVTLCDSGLSRHESVDSSFAVSGQDGDKKKQEPRNKRPLKCLSSHYGKELQVKPNRARSHSSVGVDEILRTQDLHDIGASESRRKSRRVSLGMRPKFSNWSKVKGAFKRDKSNSRVDSRDEYADTACYVSGDEGGEKVDPYSSSSHENTGQMSSSEEEFGDYTDEFFSETGIGYQMDEVGAIATDGSEYATNGTTERTISRSKSHVLQPHGQNIKLCNSPNVNTPMHKNPFKWYRTKSITPTGGENGVPEGPSNPPSPFKNSRFLYDDDSVCKLTDDASGTSTNTENPDEMLQEVQSKYEWLQKRLSREFYEKYHDWRRIRDSTSTADDDDKTMVDVDMSKLSPYLEERNLSPGFRQKFQEWQKLKGLSLSPTRAKAKNENHPNTLKKSKSDWHKWRPGSKSESNVLRFLDREQGKPALQPPPDKKDLAWLEKELQEVSREKQRLEKEREKYAERETRLQNMKRAIKSGRKRKQEVLVPTSTGLFRFQGISSKFTRKLYEWEKAKGITAESSTFALLDPYYNGPKIQRNVKPQISDTIAALSRSRSVGSVDVAGVGTSILQSAAVNHQQSSLSLNDMEQLEEAHLQVENDNLMRSSVQLFDNEDDKRLDLIASESLDIPDYDKNDISRNIPLLSSSNKSLQDSNCDPSILCSDNYSKARDDRKLSDDYGTDSESVFRSYSGGNMYEIPSGNKEQRDTANADAESIVNQIKKLRAGTSVDDEDRINTLTNLQHLADQLLEMVRIMNNKRNENVDELAARIAELAVELKRGIKNLTSDELQASNEKHAKKMSRDSEKNYKKSAEFYCGGEDGYTDTEENDSPTVHCTFTLPSWRVKHTTPSSTESESSNTRNKYADAKPSSSSSKNERHRTKHYKDDNSSGGDENYDGGDETTVYLDLRAIKTNKGRRESSDNVSTSNSESLANAGAKNFGRVSPEPGDEVLYCSLTLDRHSGNEIKTNYSKERRLNAVDDKHHAQSGAECEWQYGSDNDDQALKTEVRSYSPKPVSSKRKCASCGKVKRISKSRKVSNNYCPCGKKDSAGKSDPAAPKKSSESANQIPGQSAEANRDAGVTKSASYSNGDDLEDGRSSGRISRSRVYDFKSLTDIDKTNGAENETSKAINVIVPTTRKIFAPLKQDENGGACAVVSFTVDECENVAEEKANRDPKFIAPPWLSDRAQSASPSTGRRESKDESGADAEARSRKKSILEMHANVDKLPPASPLSVKRNVNKDSNSSIKMMIAHYNKLMSEKPERRASEGNCWSSGLQKSPVLERRHRFEHLKAESDNNIRKSKSAVLAVKNPKLASSGDPNDNCSNHLSKSSSAGSIHYSPTPTEKLPKRTESPKPETKPTLDVPIDTPEPVIRRSQDVQISSLSAPQSAPLERNSSFESIVSETKLRNLRLQEAKNKFFNEYPTKITIEYLPKREFQPSSSDSGNTDSVKKNESKNEEKIDSTSETESNFNLLLNKSVSTGAIDDRTRTCNLNMCEKSPSKSKFGFSSIASKFRKVKMRRHKDPDLNAVSSLCRASLLVNLDKDGKAKKYLNSSKSCPSSPVMQRSASKRNSSSN